MIFRHFFPFVIRFKLVVASVLFAALSFFIVSRVHAAPSSAVSGGKLITVHDRGEERVILTRAHTVGGALRDGDISIYTSDIVEPRPDSELVASDYTVNIYRARPVIVADGAVRQKIMTAEQTAEGIMTAAGSKLHSEDKAEFAVNQDILNDGAAVVLTVDRAIPFTLKLYGKPTGSYTHATTVGAMLKQKGIKLADNDTVSTPLTAGITAGMTIEIWREGVQTATVEEDVPFPTRTVYDADQPVGYRAIQASGASGKKSVIYAITARGGREVSRSVIQSIVTVQPKEQIDIVGVKPTPGSLTKSKGAQQFTDSKGVVHRETYYDLSMNSVMSYCGGGSYTVRPDGAKIDKDGFILIAANLGNYPRCSVVETSMGPGKVYDTGGFAARHPHGFDLATDWSNGDGR